MSPTEATTQVEVATPEDFERGVQLALGRLGVTLEQLRDQAQRDEFDSEEARLTWFLVGPLAAA